MTDITFLPPSPADAPPDDIPVNDGEHICTVPGCGNPVTRKGTRGRWPTKCDEHAKSKDGIKPRATKAAGNQAVQAAAVLRKLNSLIGVGLLVLPEKYRMPDTASALADSLDTFEAQAVEALSTDPELCKMILKSGVMSGRAALVVAYGMMLGSVVPTAVVELREKHAIS